MPKGAQGVALSLSGTNLKTTYTAGDPIAVGRARRVRFSVHSVRSSGSPATTTTVKLQMRYVDGSISTQYVDLPSHLDDVVGAAQPKGSTYEIEHAFTTSANATTDNTFHLDRPEAIVEMTVNLKVNTAGQSGDSTVVYYTAA